MSLRFATMAEFEAWRDRRKEPYMRSLEMSAIIDAPPPAQHKPGRMNKTEAAWAQRLEVRQRAGDIRGWRFEALKFRLADRTWYTPDFLVVSDGGMELQEVKGGYIREDSWLKWKVAREMYPGFTWSLWQLRRTQWTKLA